MYTILLNEDNRLVTTIKERIMQRSKLVDNLHFLVDPVYKGIDMSDFTVMMEYILPISREYKTEILVKSDELYKEKLEYKLPIDTCLTREAGNIEVQLTFVKVSLDVDGNPMQQVRKTSPVTVTIVPISAWSDIIADSALTALDQRLIQVDAMINAASEMNQYLYETKADNIYYNKDEQYVQLIANGNPIGDRISVNVSNTGVESIKIDEFGNIIVNYFDGRVEDIGLPLNDFCSGVYIPNYSQDGILTFILDKEAKESKYEFDINPLNDWNPIENNEVNSNYIWEAL